MHRSVSGGLAAGVLSTCFAAASLTFVSGAHAAEPPAAPAPATTAAAAAAPAPPSEPASAPATTAAPAAEPTATDATDATAPRGEIADASHPDRERGFLPTPAEPPRPGRKTFDVDPVADGAVVAIALGFAGLLGFINGTGEIRPQQIAPSFDVSQLLAIDRIAVTQTFDDNAARYSTYALAGAVTFAAVDPILSAVREKSVQTGIVDAFMYAESGALTLAMTDMAKIAVRRPRPRAYEEAERNKDNPNFSNSNTDSALSFFSGHAAIVAALGTTATYLAFVRSPRTARPWITAVLAGALTAYVSYERVRAGAHFPTDVIAGAVAGGGVGLIVPHLHRTEDIKQRRVWVGFSPYRAPDGGGGGAGGSLQVSGVF